MRTTRRDSRARWFLLLAAAITLLPPGAWSLCLDRADGHVAIEPTAGGCVDEGDSGGDACGAQSHDACEDYVLVHGQFATARDGASFDDVAITAVLPPGVWPAVASTRVAGPPSAISRIPSASPDKPTVLRC
jgi:hypothetical protein